VTLETVWAERRLDNVWRAQEQCIGARFSRVRSDNHGPIVKLGQAELVCVDEAAAIPLPLVKNLLGPYLVFLSSTISG